MCVADTMRKTWEGARNLTEQRLKDEGATFERDERGSPHVPYRTASDVASIMGSRWYASLYYMHRDIWTMAQQLPVEEVERVANEQGCQEFAAAYKVYVSRSWTAKELEKEPWPGFSPTSTLSWECAQKMIPALSQAVIANLPRAMWSPEKRAQLARLLAMGRRQPRTQVRVPPRMQTLVRMMREGRKEAERAERRREALTGYALPIGLGVVALAAIGGLYWYAKRREEQQVVQNLPAWEDDE
jgi:hypothetical protein